MCHKYIHCEDTTQSLLIYTERQQRFCVHAATYIHHIHIHCKDMIQSLHIYTLMWHSKLINLWIFWSTYMHRRYIHCKDTTQSLLIYTEQQQRLCACVATHIHHIYIHCKDITQLLHIYTFAWCSKSIDFLLYWINLHASQSHTLQKHDTVFTYIYRTTATSLCICCNSYTSHTYTLRRHNSAFAHIHIDVTQ